MIALLKNAQLRESSFIIGALLMLMVSLYTVHSLHWYDEVVDDAYISFRYVRNLVRGDGLVFNQGEKLEGYSNFLWILIIAFFMKGGFHPLFISKILGFISAVGTLFITYMFSSAFLERRSLYRFIPSLLLACNYCFASWSMLGMETSFYGFLLILSFYLLWRELQRGDTCFPLSSLIFSLACLTRPEAPIFLVALIAYRLSTKKRWDSYDSIWAGCFSFIMLSYFLWRYGYFGEWLTNSFYAKALFLPFMEKLKDPYLRYFITCSGSATTIFYCSGAILFIIFFRKTYFLLAAPVILTIFFCIYFGGDWMPNFRFLVPILPLFFLLLIVGFYSAYKKLATKKTYIKCTFLLIVSLLAVFHIKSDIKVEDFYARVNHKRLKPRHWYREVILNFGKGFPPRNPKLKEPIILVLENVGKDGKFVFPNIGLIGYVTDCYLIDSWGLTDKEIATVNYLVIGGKISPSQVKRRFAEFLDYFFAKNPEIIFLLRNNNNKNIKRGEQIKLIPDRLIFNSDHFKNNWKRIDEFPLYGEASVIAFKKRDLARMSLQEKIERYQTVIQANPYLPFIYQRLLNLYQKRNNREEIRELRTLFYQRFPLLNITVEEGE